VGTPEDALALGRRGLLATGNGRRLARSVDPSALRLAKWPASVTFCAVFPALVLVTLFVTAKQIDAVAIDFGGFYTAAQAVLRHDSPYVSVAETTHFNGVYVYPPLTAVGVIPFTVLPREAAGFLAMAILVVALLAIPVTLGVRDWRCFGLALLWPPAIQAIQTGSVTIFLALGAAIAWRLRDRRAVCALSVGTAMAMKLILWPLLVWLAAARREVTAAVSYLVGVALVVGSWAVVGFAGLTQYPQLLDRLQAELELNCYTVYVTALDVGASAMLARAIWLVVGVALLAGVVFAGRRGDERTAFVLAIAAALSLTPIVWLHYFTLLLVVVSIAQPKLGAAWIAPLLMVVATGNGNPAPYQTAATLFAAMLTVVLSVRAIRAAPRPRSEPVLRRAIPEFAVD
jgi:hypothetical protein